MSFSSLRRKGIPSWILGYRDLLFLLLVFFVVLASGHGGSGGAGGTPGLGKIKSVKERAVPPEFKQEVILLHLVEKLEFVLSDFLKSNDAEIVDLPEGYVLRLKKEALFVKDTLELRKEIVPTLQKVANLMSTIPNYIEVRGHTDNRPADPNSSYPSNWAVGAGMASALADFLATKGAVDPLRVKVVSQGEYQPTHSNETDEGRADNRRVEILISRQVITKTTPPGTTSAPAPEASSAHAPAAQGAPKPAVKH